MDSRNPMAMRAPGSARMMYHISVLPREFSCSRANSSLGCTCTDRRSEVKTNFTSSGTSASNHTSPIFVSEPRYQGKRSVAPHTFSRKRVGSRTGPLSFTPPLSLTNELIDPIEAALQFFQRSGVRNSDVLGGAESFAWHQGDMRLRQEFLRELQGRRNAIAE